MYKWMVKLHLQIDDSDDMIRCVYFTDANNVSEALAKACNDMLDNDLKSTGQITHCKVKQIGEYK